MRPAGKTHFICNNYLTLRLLRIPSKAVPLYPVISFSVINYVVSMRHPRVSDEVSSFFIYHPTQSQGSSEKVGWNVAVRTGVAEHPVTGFVVCMECYSEVSIKK